MIPDPCQSSALQPHQIVLQPLLPVFLLFPRPRFKDKLFNPCICQEEEAITPHGRHGKKTAMI